MTWAPGIRVDNAELAPAMMESVASASSGTRDTKHNFVIVIVALWHLNRSDTSLCTHQKVGFVGFLFVVVVEQVLQSFLHLRFNDIYFFGTEFNIMRVPPKVRVHLGLWK